MTDTIMAHIGSVSTARGQERSVESRYQRQLMPYNLHLVHRFTLSEQGGEPLPVDESWATSPLLPVADHIGTGANVIG